MLTGITRVYHHAWFIPTLYILHASFKYNYAGGAEAMFEPLSENYEDYEWGLAQYFGYGVQACYRGFR